MRKLLLISIFIFYGCSVFNDAHNDSESRTGFDRCQIEYNDYEIKLQKCDLYTKGMLDKEILSCNLYSKNKEYSKDDLIESETCIENIKSLTCEELTNITNLESVDACPSSKFIKSKKEVCAENYLLFCENQLSSCGESELDTECEAAKYTKTNNQGLDAKTSFKMDKLLELCDSEGDTDASLNDLDCIIEASSSLVTFSCQKTFEVFRAGCTKYFD